MNRNAHLFLGVSSAFITNYFVLNVNVFNSQNLTKETIITSGILLGSSILGALLPDIDHPNSSISHSIPLLSAVYKLNKYLFTLVGKLTGVKRIEKAFKHRGIMHSLIPIIILLYFYVFTFNDNGSLHTIFLGVISGYISHLFGDILTHEGCPLLFPISVKKISLKFW